MKNIIFITLVSFFAQGLFGQNAIERHFQFLKDQEASTHISVTGKMFELINSIDIDSNDEEVQEMKDFVNKIKSFELISSDEAGNYKNNFKSGESILDRNMDELVSIVDKDNVFKVYVDEEDGIVYEIVGIGNGCEGMMVFSLLCELRLEQVGKVVSKINANDIGGLSDLKDVSLDKIRVYPNPATTNSQLNVELPEGLEDADVTIMDMNGRQVMSSLGGVKDGTLNLTGVSKGSYVVLIEKGDISIRRKVIIVD